MKLHERQQQRLTKLLTDHGVTVGSWVDRPGAFDVYITTYPSGRWIDRSDVLVWLDHDAWCPRLRIAYRLLRQIPTDSADKKQLAMAALRRACGIAAPSATRQACA